MNNSEVLKEVDALIEQYPKDKKVRIEDVWQKLGIFDWWPNTISKSKLIEMRRFLNAAATLGYNGYVCFKVGAAGCSHGMWAYVNESTNGYSPKGPSLHHSFRSGDNYWDVRLSDGTWLSEKFEKAGENRYKFSLREVKEAIAADKAKNAI